MSRAGDQFLITDPRGETPTVYRIEGDRAKLEFHVGHTVEIAGPIAPIPPSKGAKTAPDAPTYTIKAETLTYISTSCTDGRRP